MYAPKSDQAMTTKKALTVLGMVGFLFMLTFIVPARLVGLDDTPKKKKRDPLVLKTYQELKQLDGDKDGNGVPDWKDVINATMSTSTKQTVGTKTLDEATRKRLEDPNNLTVSFSKNIYIASAYAEKQGNLTDAQKSELADTVLEGEREKIVAKEYTLDDLTLVKNDSKEFIHSYGNAVGAIYLEALKSHVDQNDLLIIKAFSENKDPKVLEGLVLKKNVIEKIILKLLAVRTPTQASILHLAIINKLSMYYTVLDSLSKIESDPIRASLAYQMYQPTFKGFYDALKAHMDYFTNNNITYEKSEPGYILFSEYTK